MANLDIIRRITVEAESKGMSQLAGDLRTLSGDMSGVKTSADGLTQTVERNEKTIKSVTQSFEGLKRRLDPAAADFKKVADGAKILGAALAQNFNATEVQRYFDMLVNSTNQAKQAQLDAAAAAKTALQEQLNVDRALEAMTSRRLQREIEYAVVVQKQADEQRKRQQELRQLAAQQQGQNFRQDVEARTGVTGGSGRSARESASAFIESFRAEEEAAANAARELEGLMRLRNELRSQYDTAAVVQERANKQLEATAELYRRGEVGAEEYARAQAHVAMVAGSVTKGVGQSAAMMQNLQFQIIDVAQGLMGGMNPLTILAQQGPQVYQILQGQGGLVAGFNSLRASLMAMVGTTGLVIGGLVAGAGAALLAWNRFDSSVRNLRNSLDGLGRGGGVSFSDLMASADQTAKALDISRDQARALTTELARTGAIGREMMAQLSVNAKDFASTVGQEIPEATAALAEAFSDPAKGMDILNRQLGFLSDRTRQAVLDLTSMGKRAEAQQILLREMVPALGNAAERTSVWARAWKEVAQFASAAAEAVGQAIDGPATNADRLTAARQAVEALERQQQGGGRIGNAQRFQQQLDAARRYRDEIEKSLKTEQALTQEQQRQRGIREAADAASGAARNFLADEQRLAEVQRQINQMSQATGRPEVLAQMGMSAEELQKGLQGAKNEADALMKAIAAGGGPLKDALEAARFDNASAGMSDYQAGLAQIRHEAELLRKQYEGQADALATIQRIEGARSQAYRTGQARSAVGQFNPDAGRMTALNNSREALAGIDPATLQQLEDLGIKSSDVAEAIRRMNTALSNFRTEMETRVRDNDLDLRTTQATTAAERLAIEQERIRNEVLDQTNDTLQAAVQAEHARNKAIADANKNAKDALRDEQNAARLIGLKPVQRRQMENQIEFERRMRDSVTTGGATNYSLPGGTGGANDNAPARNAAPPYIERLIQESARVNNVSANLIREVARQESGFRANAVSSAGAAGIMQFMPGTARQYGLTNRFDPAASIMAGGRLLRDRLNARDGNVRQVLSDYNAGPGTTDAVLAGRRNLPGETQGYIRNITGRLGAGGANVAQGLGPTGTFNGFGINGPNVNPRGMVATAGGDFGTARALADNNANMEAYVEVLQSAQQRTEELRLENEAFAKTMFATKQEQDAYNEAARITNQLHAAGVTNIAELTPQINATAQAYAAAAQEARKLQMAQDAVQEAGGMAKDFFKGMISDLREGKSASEALGNALSRLADKMLDMAMNALFSGITGSGGGGLGGLLMGLLSPSKAVGGWVDGSGPYQRVDPRAFIGAPHFAKGGMVGDAMPIIAHKGEYVLNKDDVGEILKGRAANSNSNVEINIVTPPGHSAETKKSRGENGGLKVDVLVKQLAAESAGPGQPLGRVLRGNYGLNQSLTKR